MLIDALVTDKGDAILRQTPADLIGTPLLLRQFFFDQLHQIWRYFARLVRGLLASLRGLLVRLLEAIAARAGVANKLAADRRRIDANLPRDVGLRVAALQERVNLAALFAGQMEIAFGHFSSVRCAVPRKDSLPSDRQKNRHTQHGKVWREKTSASRVLAALASSPATKALDPDPFPRHSLRHAVYAALLHFGFETATGMRGQDPTQMPRSEDDNVIEAIAPSGSARISAAIEKGTTRMASSLSSACEVHHPPGKNAKLD